MKKILLFCCLIFSWNFLFAQDKQLDILLQTVENHDINNLGQLNLNLNRTKIRRRNSSQTLLNKIKSAGKNVTIKNSEITDSLIFRAKDFNLDRLIFYNCSFRKKVTIDKENITTHLAFLNCKFNADLNLTDFNTENLSCLSCQFDGNMNYYAKSKKNKIGQFLFIGNRLVGLSFYAMNIYTSSDYMGNIDFDNFIMLGNNGSNLLMSGIRVKELLYLSGNLLKRMELSNPKIDYFFSCQYCRIDSCEVNYIQESEKSSVYFGRNFISGLKMSADNVKLCILRSNRFKHIEFKGFISNYSFQLNENIFTGSADINFDGCKFSSFLFRNSIDSIKTIQIDTVKIGTKQTKKQTGLVIHIPGGEEDQEITVRDIMMKKPASNRKFRMNINNTFINESNWHVAFDDIKKIDDFYRINNAETSLAKRHEIYTAIHNAYARQGKWEQADACYYEWKQLERSRYFTLSDESFFVKLTKSVFNYLNWISCGYGIKPLRIFPFAFLVVFIFALFYFITPQPISNLEQHLISPDQVKMKLSELKTEALQKTFSSFNFDFEKPKKDLIEDILFFVRREELINLLKMKKVSRFSLNYFWNCFYFSFSTFTTVGLGDWYPSGNLNRTIVMIEGALGWLCLGLFITTYANVLLR